MLDFVHIAQNCVASYAYGYVVTIDFLLEHYILDYLHESL